MKNRLIKLYDYFYSRKLTLLLIIIIFTVNAYTFGNGATEVMHGLLANCYESVYSGEVWRLSMSFLPHADYNHLLWDVAYLLQCFVKTQATS